MEKNIIETGQIKSEQTKMKQAILCTSDKGLSCDILNELLDNNIKILYVLVESLHQNNSYIARVCQENEIEIIEGNRIKHLVEVNSFDYLFSFNYGRKIPGWLIKKAEVALNFHPAPLPRYQGCAVSSWGIINDEKKWGVTCHFLNEEFDKGNIVEVDDFYIDKDKIRTGYDLSLVSWKRSYKQFLRILSKLIAGEELSSVAQSAGHYYSRNDLNSEKKISVDMDSDEVTRRIHGLWNPPFEGAFIEIHGHKFYLIDQQILNDCGEKYEQYKKLTEQRNA